MLFKGMGSKQTTRTESHMATYASQVLEFSLNLIPYIICKTGFSVCIFFRVQGLSTQFFCLFSAAGRVKSWLEQ